MLHFCNVLNMDHVCGSCCVTLLNELCPKTIFLFGGLLLWKICSGMPFTLELSITMWVLGQICNSLLSTMWTHLSSMTFDLCHVCLILALCTDMPIFGQCPAQDDFYLVMCSHCGQVVKPQAFQAHYGESHVHVHEYSWYRKPHQCKAAAQDFLWLYLSHHLLLPPAGSGETCL